MNEIKFLKPLRLSLCFHRESGKNESAVWKLLKTACITPTPWLLGSECWVSQHVTWCAVGRFAFYLAQTLKCWVHLARANLRVPVAILQHGTGFVIHTQPLKYILYLPSDPQASSICDGKLVKRLTLLEKWSQKYNITNIRIRACHCAGGCTVSSVLSPLCTLCAYLQCTQCVLLAIKQRASLLSLPSDVKFEIDLPKKLVWIESDRDVEVLMETLKKCGKEVKYNGTKWRSLLHENRWHDGDKVLS